MENKKVDSKKEVSELTEEEKKEINDSPSKKIVEVKDDEGQTKEVIKERILG